MNFPSVLCDFWNFSALIFFLSLLQWNFVLGEAWRGSTEKIKTALIRIYIYIKIRGKIVFIYFFFSFGFGKNSRVHVRIRSSVVLLQCVTFLADVLAKLYRESLHSVSYIYTRIYIYYIIANIYGFEQIDFRFSLSPFKLVSPSRGKYLSTYPRIYKII